MLSRAVGWVERQDGDELWHWGFRASPLMGMGGKAIVRNGHVIADVVTWES
jgi:hypothetical protein